MKRSILTVACLMWAGVVLAAEPVKMAVDDAAAWLTRTPGAQVVDVRTAEEYAGGHLQGALRVTWGEADFERQALAALDKSMPLFVYCRSGRRSAEAVKALEKLGFGEIRELAGGITAWQKAGRAVIKDK